MNFLEAMELIKKGKYIRRPCFQEGTYLTHEYGEIRVVWNEGEDTFKCSFESTNATDWEEYVEKESKKEWCKMCKFNFVSECTIAKKVKNLGCDKFEWN